MTKSKCVLAVDSHRILMNKFNFYFADVWHLTWAANRCLIYKSNRMLISLFWLLNTMFDVVNADEGDCLYGVVDRVAPICSSFLHFSYSVDEFIRRHLIRHKNYSRALTQTTTRHTICRLSSRVLHSLGYYSRTHTQIRFTRCYCYFVSTCKSTRFTLRFRNFCLSVNPEGAANMYVWFTALLIIIIFPSVGL